MIYKALMINFYTLWEKKIVTDFFNDNNSKSNMNPMYVLF